MPNRPFILREESWLDQAKYDAAFERALAEGIGEAWLVAFHEAESFGVAIADLAALPAWALDQLHEWFGES